MVVRVALYTRVSTDAQDTTNQVLALREWAIHQGHTIVAEYQDIASGTRRREHLDDLFADARRRKFDLVAIWSLDRLTREGPLQTLLYLQRLTAMGVRVYSQQEPYLDPSLPFYESIVAFLADIAKWERVRRSERTLAGLQRARKQGKRLGRPRIEELTYCRRCKRPYSQSHFEKDGHNRAESVAKRLATLDVNCLSIAVLAQRLNVSRHSVMRLVERSGNDNGNGSGPP